MSTEAQIADLLRRVIELETDAKTVKSMVEEILAHQRRQQGFLAGIVFILSGLWGLFITFKDKIIDWAK